MAEHTWRALDQAERALRATPYCACGRATHIVERDGALWLECPVLRAEGGSMLGRLSVLIGPVEHTREPIVDLVPQAA